jgi:23S rRNA (uridine2552-2'-O)-methyltransferase
MFHPSVLEMVMKSSRTKSSVWEDYYARRAKNEQFPARSVYKLKEIQRKYNLIKKGYSVLDLGCSPGSWLLYAAELVGETGRVRGLDLKAITIKLPEHVHVITGVDSARSFALCQAALSVAKINLVTGGSFVCKIFQGEDFQTFVQDVGNCFQQRKVLKPKSSRKASKEIYIIGMNKK